MKRRLFSLLLALLMVVTVLPVSVFAQVSQIDAGMDQLYRLQFAVDKVTAGNDDETVTVSIKVERNGGFAGINYQLIYDNSLLTLEEEPELGNIAGLELVSGPLSDGKHIGMVSTTDGKNVYADGTLVTYTFKLNNEAQAGDYGIRLITSGVAQIPGGQVELEVLDENGAFVPNMTANGSVTLPGYKVSYDANGGEGAPATVTKTKNRDVIISSVRPVREGYFFLGWAESSAATAPDYTGGEKYTKNEDVVLYAVWEEIPEIAGTVDIIVEETEGRTGATVDVVISVENNPGLCDMEFDVIFDETKLEYVTAELVEHDDKEIEIGGFWFYPPNKDAVTNKMKISLAQGENLFGDGGLVKITFNVLEEAEDGFSEISVVPVEAHKFVGAGGNPTMVLTEVTNGGVSITSELDGDINHDETVNSDDAALLLKHILFGESLFPIEYKGSIDFDGNGNIDSDDAVRLLKYSLFGDQFPIE